jgi:hypothetical protein
VYKLEPQLLLLLNTELAVRVDLWTPTQGRENG